MTFDIHLAKQSSKAAVQLNAISRLTNQYFESDALFEKFKYLHP